MKKHTSLYKKMLTFVLSFAMIAGFWGGITLDARAENKSITPSLYTDSLDTVKDLEPIEGNSSITVHGITNMTCNAHIWILEEKKDDYSSISHNDDDYASKYSDWIKFDLTKNSKIDKDSNYNLQIKLSKKDSTTYDLYIYLTKVQEQTQTVSNIAITVPQPVGGQALPDFPEVTYTVTGAEAISISWYEGNEAVGYSVKEAKYNTVYTMMIRYKVKDGYIFDNNTTATVNNGTVKFWITAYSDDKKGEVTYTFPPTEADPEKTINLVNIEIDSPEAGKPLATTCNVSTNVSTQGVTVKKVEWFEGLDNVTGQVAGERTTYQLRVYLTLKNNYRFGGVQTKVNGDTSGGFMYDVSCVYHIFNTGSEPSGGDYKIIEGNNSNYVPGSDKPLSFRGNGKCDKFVGVEVDGDKVEETNYEVAEGSTIITFKPDYLATLSEGPHTVKMFWNVDGEVKSATGSFYIGENGGEVVPGNATQPGNKPEQRHTCNFQWTMTLDPSVGMDGLEEYKCIYCGAVQESHTIPAGIAYVKELYGDIKNAPKNGSVTYDAGKLYTISDYLLKKMAERNDVAVTIKFEYQNKKYQLTFPAGLNYSAVLTDEETMYGYFGVAAKLGLKVVEQ